MGTVRIYCVLSSHKDVATFSVQRHTAKAASCVFQYSCRLSLSSTGNHERQDPVCRGDIEGSNRPTLYLKPGDGLLRFEYDTLSRAAVMY
jgi:hypothetical protein